MRPIGVQRTHLEQDLPRQVPTVENDRRPASLRVSREWEALSPREVCRALSAADLHLDAVIIEMETSQKSGRQLAPSSRWPRARRVIGGRTVSEVRFGALMSV